MDLYSQWLDAKRREDEARDHRRQIEDELINILDIDQGEEGPNTVESMGYKIRITRRMNRKIDSEKLQEIAIENGLQDHLGSLFRWRPEINKKAWDAASSDLTRPLLDAITTTPGRPSFAIEINQEK